MKRIYCNIEKCLACKSCELACAVAHSDTKNLVDALNESKVSRSRVRVEYIDDNGQVRKERAIAVQCRHCEEPMCVQACISGGIRKDEATGEIIVNLDKCVGCWSCIMVCPVGAIVKNADGHRALKCDNCPDLDEPACIIACPTHALSVIDEMEKGGQS